MLLREFDERTGWSNGFASCAHWLHWRTGIDLGAAREKVRVARALPALPRISATMQRGAISYAKVRALTRVATPENEAALLDFAQAGTAAQVERLVRAWRRVDAAAAAAQEESRHLSRQLSTWVDDDGMVVIRGRLTPEVGAVVQRALEAAADRLFREARDVAKAEQLAEEVTPAQRRADALGLLAEAALAADLDRGSAGDRYQVVLHVEAANRCGSRGRSVRDAGGGPRRGGRFRGNVATHFLRRRGRADASRRRRRGAGRRPQDAHGAARHPAGAAGADRSCRFPGCTARRCDAHHVEHWVDGGATSLDNLMLLCRRHHRAVHEGGFKCGDTKTGGDVPAPEWYGVRGRSRPARQFQPARHHLRA